MHTKIYSATISGMNAHLVTVEVDFDESSSRSEFTIVGLPDTAIRESRKRITTALKNNGFILPNHKITVNLSPASLRKEGTLFDLPIALGILKSIGALGLSDSYLNSSIIIGELSLDGSINPIKGVLAISSDALKLGKQRIILPVGNSQEAALIKDVEVIGLSHLKEIFETVTGKLTTKPTKVDLNAFIKKQKDNSLSFDSIKGQNYAKRAAQIAAAGKHNIIFSGSPGSGKTMLAKCIITIMPDMRFDEIIQTTKIYSVGGKLDGKDIIADRPFRSPHHSTTRTALIGGGAYIVPGEISLAHNGILFLDEITEFSKESLESLREPIENKHINIARAKESIQFPTDILLVAAYNPCPCGFYGEKLKQCKCSPSKVNLYQSKLSGPLLDRIDMRIGVKTLDYTEATNKVISSSISATELKAGVDKAILTQNKRFGYAKSNSNMNINDIEQFCTLTPEAEIIIQKAFTRLNLSMRAYHKVLKLSRTIADIDGSDKIEVKHITEAIMYKYEK